MKLFDGLGKNVVVLGVVSFLTDISSEMVFPIVPLFLSAILGVGKEIIGLIEGLADSIAGMTDIVFGYWSDRAGERKKFVIAGYGLSSVLKAGLIIANSWPAVMVIRGAERIGKSLRTPSRDAIIAANTEAKYRGKAFGFHRMMDTVGAIFGPMAAYAVLSSLGETEAGFRTVFTIALVPAVLAVIVIALFVREPKRQAVEKAGGQKGGAQAGKPAFWESLRALGADYKRFLGISCLFSLSYFSFGLLMVRANDIGLAVQDTLLAYTAYNIVYVLVSMPAGSLSDRIGRRPVIAGAFALYGFVLIGFVFAGELWHVVALFAAYGVFVAVDESVNKAYVSDISDEKTRAMALGAYSSACGAVYLPANLAFGIVWAAFGAAPAFGAAAVIAIIAGLLMALKAG